MLVPFFVIALVIARASGREGASELLGMRHPEEYSGKLRQFLCINGTCTHRLSWHRTLLIGLDPSRNKDYSLRSMHVLLQLRDACASYCV